MVRVAGGCEVDSLAPVLDVDGLEGGCEVNGLTDGWELEDGCEDSEMRGLPKKKDITFLPTAGWRNLI